MSAIERSILQRRNYSELFEALGEKERRSRFEKAREFLKSLWFSQLIIERPKIILKPKAFIFGVIVFVALLLAITALGYYKGKSDAIKGQVKLSVIQSHFLS